MRLFIVILAFTLHHAVHAQKADTLKYCVTRQNFGVGGYDPVSYFQGLKPLTGKENFSTVFEGVTYKFDSESNLKDFVSNPNKYLPQFGGWCSMTLAMGRATTPKYDNFVVLKDKLYLFERTVSVNGRELWLKDPKANEKVAAANYKSYRTTGKIK